MNSYIIGTVYEPEVKEIDTKKGLMRRILFTLRSGRNSVNFTVWNGNKALYEAAEALSDGDCVCCIVGDSVDEKGRLQHYLNGVAFCPESLRDELRALFVDES